MTLAIIIASIAASVAAVLITGLICAAKTSNVETICKTITEGFRSITVDVENRLRVGGKGEK